VPNTDAVQEANIQQNSVDAEFGHSAGGTISINTKGGTNDLHVTAFYLGRNPDLNAVTDRTTGSFIAARNNIWGVSGGNPILKNKLFNFASVEQQQPHSPGTTLWTMPTALERAGDFSKSLTAAGALRTIYDPYTTVFNPATGTATRQPFAGNVIPSSLFDPLGSRIMNDLAQYAPNANPSNLSGLNNFHALTNSQTDYWDISDRVDWYVSSKWRVFSRFGIYRTNILTAAPSLVGDELYVQGGSKRNGFQLVGDAIYTMSSSTVIEIHADDHHFIDEYYSPNNLGSNAGLAKYWPNNP
jgi:hypothetical protein